jgi:hypothetical protein
MHCTVILRVTAQVTCQHVTWGHVGTKHNVMHHAMMVTTLSQCGHMTTMPESGTETNTEC